MLPNLQTSLLGNDDGAGFGWQDILVVKAGAQWQSSENLTWRAGYSWNDQPIPDTEVMFNILAPGVEQHHITGGLSYVLKERHDLSFALMYSPSNTVTGKNPLDPAQTIELEMSEWELVLGYAFF
jgi:long-chain fatty acid transport protein